MARGKHYGPTSGASINGRHNAVSKENGSKFWARWLLLGPAAKAGHALGQPTQMGPALGAERVNGGARPCAWRTRHKRFSVAPTAFFPHARSPGVQYTSKLCCAVASLTFLPAAETTSAAPSGRLCSSCSANAVAISSPPDAPRQWQMLGPAALFLVFSSFDFGKTSNATDRSLQNEEKDLRGLGRIDKRLINQIYKPS